MRLLVQTTCLCCHVWKESDVCEHKKDMVSVVFKRKKLAEVFLKHFPRFQHMFHLLTLEWSFFLVKHWRVELNHEAHCNKQVIKCVERLGKN